MLLCGEMPMMTVVESLGRFDTGLWRTAAPIEAAHAKVPERRCDEFRLMKPAPDGALAMSPMCLLFRDGQGG